MLILLFIIVLLLLLILKPKEVTGDTYKNRMVTGTNMHEIQEIFLSLKSYSGHESNVKTGDM